MWFNLRGAPVQTLNKRRCSAVTRGIKCLWRVTSHGGERQSDVSDCHIHLNSLHNTTENSRCVLCDVGKSWEARTRCSSTSLSSTHPPIHPSIHPSVHPSPLLLLACRVWLSQLEDIWTATGGKRAPLLFFLPFFLFFLFFSAPA